MAPEHVEMYVKVESFNPLASVKDRLAIAIVEDAERKGLLKPGQTVVEATSGNTGIALAMVCAAKGYPFVATMAESFSVERRKIMRGLGAKVILTPAAERGSGMVRKAEELARIPNIIATPRVRRSCAILRAGGWTTGSAATAPVVR
jgi:cysteine synthase A